MSFLRIHHFPPIIPKAGDLWGPLGTAPDPDRRTHDASCVCSEHVWTLLLVQPISGGEVTIYTTVAPL